MQRTITLKKVAYFVVNLFQGHEKQRMILLLLLLLLFLVLLFVGWLL